MRSAQRLRKHLQRHARSGLMPTMATELTDILQQALAAAPPGPLYVAYSGGPDSSALLHALAALAPAHARGLHALHVDHGLSADSAQWSAHCLRQCARWQVPLTLLRVQVQSRGEGVEAAARHARYAALATQLPVGALLLTAQHRDDQAETVLLKLLRGAGPHGLAGMRAQRRFAGGWLLRPLLETPRAVLRAHLDAWALASVDDPANRDCAHARSLLRTQVLPLLRTHWPDADAALAHAARLQRALADELDARAAALLASLSAADGSLDAAGWLVQPATVQALLLEHWLHAQGLPAPDGRQRRALLELLQRARRLAHPQLRYGAQVLRLWHGRLYAATAMPARAVLPTQPWRGTPLQLPAGGRLLLDPPRLLEPALQVRAARAGERLLPHGRQHAQRCVEALRAAGVPPWLRAHCPLIETADGQLLALGDRVFTTAGASHFGALGAWPRWWPQTPVVPCTAPPPD